MYNFLRTLAISVESTIDQDAILAEQAAKERITWIVLIAVSLVIAVALSLALPKIVKNLKAKKKARLQKKAERKRIQSKRK